MQKIFEVDMLMLRFWSSVSHWGQKLVASCRTTHHLPLGTSECHPLRMVATSNVVVWFWACGEISKLLVSITFEVQLKQIPNLLECNSLLHRLFYLCCVGSLRFQAKVYHTGSMTTRPASRCQNNN